MTLSPSILCDIGWTSPNNAPSGFVTLVSAKSLVAAPLWARTPIATRTETNASESTESRFSIVKAIEIASPGATAEVELAESRPTNNSA
ncbi:MAG: hypothetical protein AAF266_10950 [Planctomycetota bacterium]